MVQRSANHELDDSIDVICFRGASLHHRAVPQYCDVVGDAEQFVQSMRYVDNPGAFSFELSDLIKENIYLFVRYGRGWFIHDDDV